MYIIPQIFHFKYTRVYYIYGVLSHSFSISQTLTYGYFYHRRMKGNYFWLAFYKRQKLKLNNVTFLFATLTLMPLAEMNTKLWRMIQCSVIILSLINNSKANTLYYLISFYFGNSNWPIDSHFKITYIPHGVQVMPSHWSCVRVVTSTLPRDYEREQMSQLLWW